MGDMMVNPKKYETWADLFEESRIGRKNEKKRNRARSKVRALDRTGGIR